VTDEQLSQAVVVEIRRLLDERAMSGNALAKATGIPQTSIAKKLRGITALDIDDVDRICRALDVKASDLMEWAQRA
jgi:DNA-binding Xre family transcriptional regulator